MNFLAHIYLSGSDDHVRLGNFIGDFVKGKELEQYPEKMQVGIKLHRAIDYFTDHHPVVRESKKMLSAHFRHYAAVIVDVYYDYFLAKEWTKYDATDLLTYTQAFYKLTERESELLPPKAKHMLTYMKRDNWLFHYQYQEGIHRALSGMARRSTFESKMEHGANFLSENEKQLQQQFDDFFPEIDQYCKDFLLFQKSSQ